MILSTGTRGGEDLRGLGRSCQALARAGRLDEARLAFEKMLTYANHVGPYAEQISRADSSKGTSPRR